MVFHEEIKKSRNSSLRETAGPFSINEPTCFISLNNTRSFKPARPRIRNAHNPIYTLSVDHLHSSGNSPKMIL